MKLDIKLIALALVVIACIGGSLFWQFSDSPPKDEPSSAKVRANDSARDQRRARSVRRIAPQRAHAQPREKPALLDLDDDEMRELTELAKQILESLQSALDMEDFKQIQAITDVVHNAPKGALSNHSDGLPVFLRKRLVEAVGWFGASGLPEIVDFLYDEDPEVAETAMAQFELALEDVTLGDRARAEIVVLACKALHETEALERIMMEIPNMRNSVAAQTLIDICYSGTEEAKSLMPETIDFVTGEEDIATIEELQRWLDENPDGPDDDDLYGPMSVD